MCQTFKYFIRDNYDKIYNSIVFICYYVNNS